MAEIKYFNRSEIYKTLEVFGEAVEDINAAVKLNPNSNNYLNLQKELLEKLHEQDTEEYNSKAFGRIYDEVVATLDYLKF